MLKNVTLAVLECDDAPDSKIVEDYTGTMPLANFSAQQRLKAAGQAFGLSRAEQQAPNALPSPAEAPSSLDGPV